MKTTLAVVYSRAVYSRAKLRRHTPLYKYNESSFPHPHSENRTWHLRGGVLAGSHHEFGYYGRRRVEHQLRFPNGG